MSPDPLVSPDAIVPPWDQGAPEVTVKLSSANGAIRDVLGELDAALVDWQVGAETRSKVEIVLAEILNNIVEHAYGWRDHGQIEVSLILFRTRLVARVIDFGKAMPDNRLPQKRLADLDVKRADLPEGGWGWYLVQELADNLSYIRKGNMNTVRFSIRIT